jgi:hypothetical protein
MATKRASKQIKYGIIRQNPASAAATAFMAIGNTSNQWTNPGLAATNYRTVYYTAGVPIPDPGVTVDEYNVTSQLGLNKELTNFFIDKRSGLARLNFSAPLDVKTLAPHLIGALQAVVEDAGTPFQKVITSGFTAGTIDFKAGSGYLHSLAINQGASADDGTILENAIIDTLNLTFDFNAKGVARLVQIDGSWVGNEMNFDQTLSGTWVSTTLTPLNNLDLFSFNTFTVDSVDWSTMCIRRMVLSINNNVTSNCATTAGKPNQYDVMPEITWTIVLDHNSTTEKLMGDFQAGAAVDIDLINDYAVAVSDGALQLDTPNCRIIAPPQVYNGDFLGYSLQARAYQSSTTSPLTVTFIDTLDWGY